jgi:hypothetical protein
MNWTDTPSTGYLGLKLKDTLRLLLGLEEKRERRRSVSFTWAITGADARWKQNAAKRNARGVPRLLFRARDSLAISSLRSDFSTRSAGGSKTLSSGEKRRRITPKGDIQGDLAVFLASRSLWLITIGLFMSSAATHAS